MLEPHHVDLLADPFNAALVRRLLELARDEDLGPSGIDMTAEAVGSAVGAATAGAGRAARFAVRAREAGIVSGLAIVPALLDVFGANDDGGPDSVVVFEPRVEDGDPVIVGSVLGELRGPPGLVVVLERTLLNLVGRLSGVATLTARYIQAAGPGVQICDTRKTTPGLRVLEKYAVRSGGGYGHRLGLHDAVLIKDNHLAGVSDDRLAAFVRAAVERARQSGHRPTFVEIEVDRLSQLKALLELPAGLVDYVLLDNMTTDELASAVGMRDQAGVAVRLEASGGVSLATIGAIAATGVDRISIGALTHSARSLDVGLDAAAE